MVNATQLRTHLETELGGILTKQTGDSLHYKLNAQNHLCLVQRPRSCFVKFIELLRRCLTRSMPKLQNKFADIAQQLETWLGAELDDAEKIKFLAKYTPAINVLLSSANRMKQARRIALAPQVQPLTRAFISVKTHSVTNLSSVSCTNTSGDDIYFDFQPRDQPWTNELSSNTPPSSPSPFPSGRTIHATATSSPQVLRTVTAYKREVVALPLNMNYALSIPHSGKLDQTSALITTGTQRQYTIDNQQTSPATIHLSGQGFNQTINIPPLSQQTVNIPDGTSLDAEVLYNEMHDQFTLGPTSAHYAWAVYGKGNILSPLTTTLQGIDNFYSSPLIDIVQNGFNLDYTGAQAVTINTTTNTVNTTTPVKPTDRLVTNNSKKTIDVVFSLHDKSKVLPSITLPPTGIAPKDSRELKLRIPYTSLQEQRYEELLKSPHLQCTVEIIELIDTAAQLRANLEAELKDIKTKRKGDAFHFKLDANNHLQLVQKPQNCFRRLLKCLTQCFTRPMPKLQSKFSHIAQQVETWLKAEKDEQARSKFLNTYTSSLDALFNSATRMQQAKRIALAPQLQHLTRAYICTNTHSVTNLSTIMVGNKSKEEVIFDFQPRDQPWTNTLSTKNPLFDPYVWKRQAMRMAPATMSPDTKRTVTIFTRTEMALDPATIYNLTIPKTGALTAQKSKLLSTGLFSLDNQKTVSAEVNLRAPNYKHTFTVDPLSKQTIFIPKYQDLFAEIIYNGQKTNFTLGCKAGEYICLVDDDGDIATLPMSTGVKNVYTSPLIDFTQNKSHIEYEKNQSIKFVPNTHNSPLPMFTNKTGQTVALFLQLHDKSNALPPVAFPAMPIKPDEEFPLLIVPMKQLEAFIKATGGNAKGLAKKFQRVLPPVQSKKFEQMISQPGFLYSIEVRELDGGAMSGTKKKGSTP